MMTFGSLFAGIGGIDLGLERAGMVCRWQSEIDPYACQVLAKHWPDIPNLGDIRDIDWTGVERTDLVAGGYPCQPFSTAGRRAGGDDPRHLWPLFADCLRVVRPRYALLENVTGHLSLGFGRVLGDLAEIGYDAEWDCIPAAAVGAPHLRDRVFVIATRRESMADSNYSRSRDRRPESDWRAEPRSGREAVADASSPSSEGGRLPVGGCSEYAESDLASRQWPAPSPDSSERGRPRSGRSEYPGDTTPSGQGEADQPLHDCYWATEPGMGRVANGIPHGVDRLRALGNAVVPQVAEHVGRIILRMETQ